MTDGVFNDAPVVEAPVTPPADPTVDARLQAKDQFIEQLKTETSELREELARRVEVAKLLEEARNNAANPPQSKEATPASKEPAQPLDEAAIVERVIKAQEERTTTQRQQANAQAVVDHLVELYGSADAANKIIKAKAEELEVPVSYLLDTAKTSPKAFYDLVKLEQAPKQAAAPRSNVNTAALAQHAPGVKEGTAAWYEELRKSDPVKFFSPKIQQQRMKEALAKGDAFFA